jgi:dihydrofolate reductase
LWSAGLTGAEVRRQNDYLGRMRKVTLWIGMSLDGYTSGPNEQLDWLAPHVTPQANAYFEKMRERSDTILVGRVNYEGYFGYWPRMKDDPKASRDDVEISRWLDDVTKVVFSRTLHEVTWKNARLARGDAAEEVGALKRAPGKDIIIQNSTRLTQSLLAAGLVDEVNIMVAPAVVGAGRALFAGTPRTDLRLADLTRFDDGTFVVRYDVKPRA